MRPRTITRASLMLCALCLGVPAHADDGDALLEEILGGSGSAQQAPPAKASAKQSQGGKAAKRTSKRRKASKRDKAKRSRGKAARAAEAERAGARGDEGESPAERRKVVITEFVGPSGGQVRQTVLEVFSEQRDLDIAGYNDVKIVAKRLGADPTSEAGRAALSGELGIDGWVDGRITDNGADITLSDPQGVLIAKVKLDGRSAGKLRGEALEKAWRGLGPYLSEAERDRQILEAYKQAAQQKLEAQQAELARQRELAVERERRRKAHLEEARALALRKQDARLQETRRQREVARERRVAAERERQRKAEEERRRMAELQRKRREEQMAARQAAQPPQGFGQQPPAQSWSAAPQPAVGTSAGPAPPSVSPATQRWLQQRRASTGHGAQPQPAPARAAPARAAPAQPAPAQTAPAPAPAVDPSMLSPETRKWLEERRRQQSGQ